ncbi:MAG: hypothetical protein ABEJ34_02030 [Haloferacaceae archaeon]
MLDAEWSVEEVADVTLVEVTVHNPTAVDRRVRVEDRLDGPTLPPRSDGIPERGWDADGYDGVVPAGERLRLGYASPSPPTEPPVSIEDEGRAEDAERDRRADAVEAVRLLDNGAPPADALPATADDRGENGTPAGATGTTESTGEADPRDGADAGHAGSGDGTAGAGETGDCVGSGTAAGGPNAEPGAIGAETGDRTGPIGADPANGRSEADGPTPADAGAGSGVPDPTDGRDPATGDPPAPVAEWFADVERRVDDAERLTGASVVEAAAVLDERDGLSGVESLSDRVGDDEAALRAVAERAAATDVPLAALRRLS